jgi:hypothetical protein
MHGRPDRPMRNRSRCAGVRTTHPFFRQRRGGEEPTIRERGGEGRGHNTTLEVMETYTIGSLVDG